MRTRADLTVGLLAGASAVGLVTAASVLKPYVPVVNSVVAELAVLPALCSGGCRSPSRSVASMLAFNFFFLHDARSRWMTRRTGSP
jgi:hypothetical protein